MNGASWDGAGALHQLGLQVGAAWRVVVLHLVGGDGGGPAECFGDAGHGVLLGWGQYW